MSPIAIALIITSTFTHALWNLIGKRRNSSAAFFLIASLAIAILLAPLLIFQRHALSLIPQTVWVLLLITGVFQAVYYNSLAGAYRYGQLSVAYPLARSLPALFVMIITAVLGLGVSITPVGSAGIILVVLGCLCIPLISFRKIDLNSYLNPCCALALLAAVGTTGYTIIDSEALRLLRAVPDLGCSAAGTALLFMELEFATTILWLAVYILFKPEERRALSSIIRSGAGTAAFTGVMIGGTYGLVLVAMAYVTNVSYLAAFRELSIPLGAVLGVAFQKEPAPPPKIIGIVIVLIGLFLIGLA